jgi:hypothetical protein
LGPYGAVLEFASVDSAGNVLSHDVSPKSICLPSSIVFAFARIVPILIAVLFIPFDFYSQLSAIEAVAFAQIVSHSSFDRFDSSLDSARY